MSRIGFQMHPDMLNDYAIHKLSNEEFVRQFNEAVEGGQNTVSRFVKPWHGRPPASEWARLRTAVFARDDYTCQYCGERGRKLECDHVEPVSRGGKNDLKNLVTACLPCNRSKRDKTPTEWRAAQA